MEHEDLSGLDAAGLKDYLFGLMSTQKLTEKKIHELEEERVKWEARAALAASQNRADLAAEAKNEAEKTRSRKQELAVEAETLKTCIAEIQKNLPLAAARERSVDPDLLEQELIMAAGYLPGEESRLRTERQFRELENEKAADAALSELKAKMEGKN
jgi:phage shock protein A